MKFTKIHENSPKYTKSTDQKVLRPTWLFWFPRGLWLPRRAKGPRGGPRDDIPGSSLDFGRCRGRPYYILLLFAGHLALGVLDHITTINT